MMTEREQLKTTIYLNIAKEISQLSRDENTKVGAVIVAENGEPISWGYNGGLPKVNDNLIPYNREIKELQFVENGIKKQISVNKYPFMEHAEKNAIDFADPNKLKGATIYVTHFPCSACASHIAKHGIKKVVVNPDVSVDVNSSVSVDTDISKYKFALKNVNLYIGNVKTEISIA